MTTLSLFDQDLRGLLTRKIAEAGRAPTLSDLAAAARSDVATVERSLRCLHDSHSLLLHPHRCEPWVVHPFALAPGGCWVETPERGYWANCLYCAFGIAAALHRDASIVTRLGGEAVTRTYRIEAGRLLDREGVFHLSTPPARWWDNVIFACASFQPFAAEADVDVWCARHGMPRGATMTLDALWRFASDWYGNYVRKPWRYRSPEQIRALFEANGLTGPFWSIQTS